MEELYKKCLKYPSKINDLSEADLKEFRDWLMDDKLAEIEQLASDMHDSEVKNLDRINMLGTHMHDNAMDTVKEFHKEKKGKLNRVLEKVENKINEIESDENISEELKNLIHEVAFKKSKRKGSHDYQTIVDALKLYRNPELELNQKEVAKKVGIKHNTFNTWKMALDDLLGE